MDLRWSGVLAAYGEVALKSKQVRRRFIRRLMSNIENGLSRENVKARVKHRWSRIMVETSDVESAVNVLSKVFGIVYASPYVFVNLDQLEEYMAGEAKNLLEGAECFAVRVRRTGKHSFTSLELERRLGAILKAETGLRVSLEKPGRTVFVEVHNDECYIYTEKVECAGGLPLDGGRRVVALISTGIDSPVASWLMMKRGCSVAILHAQVSPGDENPCLHKLLDIAEVLRSWHIGVDVPVYVYRHGEALREMREAASNYTCVLCKRLMLRVAERLAYELGAKAVVTGESLGQVASQTLENLNAIDEAVRIPVLRPLIGFDKNETIKLARRIGTYSISVRPDSGCPPKDVCWAKPSKPITKAKLDEVKRVENEIQADKLTEKTYETLMKAMV